MKIKEIIKKIQINNESYDYEDYEVFLNNHNTITDVEVKEKENVVILKVENGLETYYNHKSKMGVLADMIETIRLDGVIAVSEIEVVQIAHDLELSFEDVENEFKKNDINVEVL